MFALRLITAAACLTLAKAQITFPSTVLDGNTVVVSVSSDPLLGTTPIVIATLTDPLAVPTVTPPTETTTTVPVVTNTITTTTPRVVGQPGPTNVDPGPTTYRYTTTDANGNTVVLTDTYTPSYGVTTIQTTAPAGTVIPYDQYTSMYGGGSNHQISGAVRQLVACGTGASAAIGIIAGMALLL